MISRDLRPEAEHRTLETMITTSSCSCLLVKLDKTVLMLQQTNTRLWLVGGSELDQWERSRSLAGNQWVSSKYLVTVSGCCCQWPAPVQPSIWWGARAGAALILVYQQPSTGMEQQHSLEVTIIINMKWRLPSNKIYMISSFNFSKLFHYF